MKRKYEYSVCGILRYKKHLSVILTPLSSDAGTWSCRGEKTKTGKLKKRHECGVK